MGGICMLLYCQSFDVPVIPRCPFQETIYYYFGQLQSQRLNSWYLRVINGNKNVIIVNRLMTASHAGLMLRERNQ